MVAVSVLLRSVLGGKIAAQKGWRRLEGLVEFIEFANGFYDGRDGVALVS